MNRFFHRILLSVWLTIILAVALSLFLAHVLPTIESGALVQDRQLVTFVAREFETLLPEGPYRAADLLLDRDMLVFDHVLQIYVIDRTSGQDLLGRPVPSAVSDAVATANGQTTADPEFENHRLIVPSIDIPDYLVAGYSERYPASFLMAQSGSRPLLPFALLIVSAAMSFFLARFIVLPVRHLREAGHRVAAGDLTVRVAHTVGDRQDDIALLARDFDTMTERIGRLLASQQRLMRDVSHELRSPLARLQALQSLARQRFTRQDETHILDRMDGEVERLDQLIEEILAFVRLDAREQISPRRTDLADLVRTIIDDALVEVGDEDKTIRYEGPERMTLEVDTGLLHSAIENIVRNAVRFTPERGSVGIVLVHEESRVQLAVEDEGPGVPKPMLGQLFEPFFQVDDSRSPPGVGSGVGLAISRRAVQLHGGEIRAENRDPSGLRVVIALPAT